jgi:5-hydroxyisourate hydrolase
VAETSKADSGRLTTHVLDTVTGKPAAGLSIELFHIDGDLRTLLKSVVTNNDGRCDAPLLAGAEFRTGEYELVFAAGDYLRRQGLSLPKPAFLDSVPIRFGMAEPVHYHVPLLVSPYGYSTYRGS